MYGWDDNDLGRRVSIARGAGLTTTLGFDAASRLASLAHDAAGTANDQDWGFSYNPAGQILAQTATNSAWNWSYGSDSSDAYTSNGLNQYLTAGAAQPVYDGRGNMTNDGLGRVMGYDADNRLTSVARTVAAATTTSTLSYDPAGRLSQLAATAGATTNVGGRFGSHPKSLIRLHPMTGRRRLRNMTGRTRCCGAMFPAPASTRPWSGMRDRASATAAFC